MKKQLSQRGIVRLWAVQVSLVLFLALVFTVVMNENAGVSALLAGMVYLVPNAYFASKLFQYQGARSAKAIVSSFYKGEALKIILSAVLFAVVFIWFKITPLAFFISYLMVLMTHWLTPLILVNKQNRPESD